MIIRNGQGQMIASIHLVQESEMLVEANFYFLDLLEQLFAGKTIELETRQFYGQERSMQVEVDIEFDSDKVKISARSGD